MILLKRQLHNITKQAHYLFPALFTWFYLLAGPEEKTPIYHAEVNCRFWSQRVLRIESPFIDLENQYGVRDAM